MHMLHQNSGVMMDVLCSHSRITGRKITPAKRSHCFYTKKLARQKFNFWGSGLKTRWSKKTILHADMLRELISICTSWHEMRCPLVRRWMCELAVVCETCPESWESIKTSSQQKFWIQSRETNDFEAQELLVLRDPVSISQAFEWGVRGRAFCSPAWTRFPLRTKFRNQGFWRIWNRSQSIPNPWNTLNPIGILLCSLFRTKK